MLAGQAHEALGQTEAAITRYEQASTQNPMEGRAVDALYTIALARHDHDFITELLGDAS